MKKIRSQYLTSVLRLLLVVMLAAPTGCGKKKIESSPQLENTATISSIKYQRQEDPTVVITADREIAYNIFKLTSANVIVLDIPNALLKNIQEVIPINDRGIVEINTTTIQDNTSALSRLSISFEKEAQLPKVLSQESSLIVSFGENVPKPVIEEKVEVPIVPTVIENIQFKQLDEASEIRLKMTGKTRYEIDAQNDNQILIRIPQADLSQYSKRDIDTSAFASPVSLVSPKKYRDATGRGVTLLVTLKAPVRESHRYEDNDIVLQFLRDDSFVASSLDLDAAALKTVENNSNLEKIEPADQESPDSSSDVPEQSDPLPPTTTTAFGENTLEIDDSDLNNMIQNETKASESDSKSSYRGQYAVVAQKYIGSAENEEDSLIGGTGSHILSNKKGEYTGKRINIDMQDADIRDILRLLSEEGKFNILHSEEVQGRVNVRLTDVPWDQAFEMILQNKGLGYRRMGSIIRVAPTSALKKEAKEELEARKAADELKPLRTKLFPISYAKAAEIKPRLEQLISTRGKLDDDSRTNTIIVTDIEEKLNLIEDLVLTLDTQTPQVQIEAKIVEASTLLDQAFGITWGSAMNFDSSHGNAVGLPFPNSINIVGAGSSSGVPNTILALPTDGNFNAGIKLGSLSGVLDLNLRLNLAENWGSGRIISSPKLTVLSNKSSTISAGTSIPFLSQTANSGSNVKHIEATTSLTVTPHVAADGSIMMEINATRNSPDFSRLVGDNPPIKTNSANTTVIVKSGQTTVIGGIYSQEKGTTYKGIPFLSRIPVIGWLFKSVVKKNGSSELLIFVTPKIVFDLRNAVKDKG